MRHINSKDDWFYEFKPYLFISIGIVGFLSRSLFGNSQIMTGIGFLSSIILIGAGSLIISWRRTYRKSSFMK